MLPKRYQRHKNTPSGEGLYSCKLLILCGAEGETRTPMSIRTLDPEPSASTSSATSARTRANGCKRP
jgi:hypothetical protein